MAGDDAEWIRRWQWQLWKVVEIAGGSGERGRSSIGALMQSDVKMVNPSKKIDRGATPASGFISLVPCFLDQFVPEHAEVML
jgi:hypothetical protein